MIMILLAFEVKAIDQIRVFTMTTQSPFHKQELKAQCSVPCQVSLLLIVIMATYHSLQGFLPTLVTLVLFNKLWCIWKKRKKKLETTDSLFVFPKLIIFHFAI